jgi:hypothetical protein
LTAIGLDKLDRNATGLALYRIGAKNRLYGGNAIMFEGGFDAVEMVLRRAAISGIVEIEPDKITSDYYCDVYVDECSWTQTIQLDRGSYRALKYRWARTR